MLQPRFLSAFLGLAAFSVSTVGATQVSLAAANSATPPAASDTRLAQLPAADVEKGTISVTGLGQASIPADQAVIVMSFYPNGYFGSSESTDPNAPPAQPQVLPSDITAATSAANSAGISDAKAYPDFTTPGAMRVRLVVNQPTQAKLDQVIASVNTAIIKTNRYSSSGVAVGYGIRDCSVAEATVRQAAMSDANRRATALAESSGTQVGNVLSLSESMTWGTSYAGACPVADEPASYADIAAGYPYYDPSVPPSVRVIYSLSATYGLR